MIGPDKQLLTCPVGCRSVYRDYMTKRKIDFQEVTKNGILWFIIDRKFRPHAWKLDF